VGLAPAFFVFRKVGGLARAGERTERLIGLRAMASIEDRTGGLQNGSIFVISMRLGGFHGKFLDCLAMFLGLV
jgi:hypothetical protein